MDKKNSSKEKDRWSRLITAIIYLGSSIYVSLDALELENSRKQRVSPCINISHVTSEI
jgi:uncharacterized membrane protein